MKTFQIENSTNDEGIEQSPIILLKKSETIGTQNYNDRFENTYELI